MAAGEALRGLLHDRHITPTLLPLPPPPAEGAGLPLVDHDSGKYYLSSIDNILLLPGALLRAPPPTRIIPCWQTRSAPLLMTTPGRLPLFAKRACRGSWRWHSHVHHLSLLLPPPTCPALPVPAIVNFIKTLHWLPAKVLQILSTLLTCSPNVSILPHNADFDDNASIRFEGKDSYSNHDDDYRNMPALPTPISVASSTPCPPSTRIITFPCPPPINIDICKI